jgi:hypothetical protein
MTNHAEDPILARDPTFTCGMLVADNGFDWSFSVAPDERIPVLHEELRRVKGADFEVVVAP